MRSEITYWIEKDGTYLGCLNDYPDHWTRGEDFGDLVEHLKDLYRELEKGDLSGIRRVQESSAELATKSENISSPPWHVEVLLNREQRILEGKSKFLDFAEAKEAVQNRITPAQNSEGPNDQPSN